jgi:uncharacterized protein YjbI with pentapeptide repeats
MTRAKYLCLTLIILVLIEGSGTKSQSINSIGFQDLVKNKSAEIILDNYSVRGPLDLHQFSNNFSKKITVKDSTFEGAARFDQLVFHEDVVFENTSFKERVSFPGAVFLKNVSFRDSKFEKKADFSNAQFKGFADFSEVKFNGTAKFDDADLSNANFLNAKFLSRSLFGDANFNGPATFSYSEFKGPATFDGANFLNNFSAERCHFYGSSEFKDASFHNTTLFTNTYFENRSDFQNSKFERNAYFNGVLFKNPVTFRSGKFIGLVRFFGAIFNDSADFGFTNFSQDVDFSQATFHNDANFEKSVFWAYANFADARFKDANFWQSTFRGDADFDEAQFSEASFEGSGFLRNLSLKKAKYDKMYIRIEEIDKLAFDETTYKTLIDNFKKIGFIEDANNCYYRFMVEYGYQKLPGLNRIQQLNNKINVTLSQINIGDANTDYLFGRFFLSFYYLFSWILYGFGTKPMYTLFWSIFLMIVFGLFWWYVQRKSSRSKKEVDEYSWDNYYHKTSTKSDLNTKFYGITNAFLLSCSIFLSGTKFFIDPPELPAALKRVNPWVSRMFNLERFLGGVLSILFFIAIGSIIFSI